MSDRNLLVTRCNEINFYKSKADLIIFLYVYVLNSNNMWPAVGVTHMVLFYFTQSYHLQKGL